MFLVGKYFSQLARWRRLAAAAVVDVVIVVIVRPYDVSILEQMQIGSQQS